LEAKHTHTVTRANSNMLKFICTDTCVYTYSNILAYAKYAVEKKTWVYIYSLAKN